jgi:hypothetical protein
MQNKLIFKSNEQYKASLSNINLWKAQVLDVFQRHDFSKDIAQKLANNNLDITAGFNSTYPVFLIDNLVVKFFGYRHNWQEVFAAECEAHEILDKDNKILTPKILACGNLCVSDPSTTPLKTANSYDSKREELARAENR